MKTQKSFRKKALLSSIAMLLVATVAVGSATFAWFTSNTTSTADGINVKTAKSSTLEISKSDKDWKTSVNYNHTKVMFPASTATGTTFVQTSAKSSEASDRDTSKAIGSATGDSFVFSEMLNVRNNGDGKVKDVTITISKFANKYARIALVPATEDGTIQCPEGKSFVNYVYDTDGAQYQALSDTKGTEVAIDPDNSMTIKVGDLGKLEAKYFNLYIWFEGQDVDCIDTNAGQYLHDTADGNNTLSFSVTGTPDDSSVTG